MANDSPQAPPFVTFYWEKSNYFRVIHADGAYGGLTPYGGLFCCFYTDRLPLPEQTAQNVSESGQLTDEIVDKRIVKTGVEREVETCVLMNLNTAKALRDWLEQRIKLLETFPTERQETEVKQ